MSPFRRSAPMTLVVLAALAALPAAAGDGILEINQACVATGCFPGDTPGFPVSIENTGSYVLTSNLEVPDEETTAIRVFAQSVSIDLGGFTISGVTQCTGTPVVCAPTGFGLGIRAEGDDFASVRNGEIRAMGDTGIWTSNALVEGVIVRGNGNMGIFNPGGISRSNIVKDNGNIGISCSGGRAVDNEVMNSGAIGILGVSGAIIRGNQVSSSGDHGITALDAFVWDNHIFSNENFGLLGNGNTVFGNNVLFDNNDPATATNQVSAADEIAPNFCQGVPCP